jgi:hypothetical protein
MELCSLAKNTTVERDHMRFQQESARKNLKQNLMTPKGANLTASLILLHPRYRASAVLFRTLVPLPPDLIRDYSCCEL